MPFTPFHPALISHWLILCEISLGYIRFGHRVRFQTFSVIFKRILQLKDLPNLFGKSDPGEKLAEGSFSLSEALYKEMKNPWFPRGFHTNLSVDRGNWVGLTNKFNCLLHQSICYLVSIYCSGILSLSFNNVINLDL